MSSKKTLLLVSFLEPWSMGSEMGAPSLYETMVGYVAAGWHIHYLTAAKRPLGGGSHEQDIAVEIAGVTTHRFDLPAPLRLLGSRIQGKADRLYYYPKYAARAIKNLLRDIKPNLIYAYEEGAVLAVDQVRRSGLLPCPVAHRFQGTILGDKYKDWPTLLRKAESWRALCKTADFFIMTDDGTRGDRALRYWNRHCGSSNLLFIRNGIDLSIANSIVDKEEVFRRLKMNPGFITLLMVSRLAGWKRIDRGIDVLAALRSRYPMLRLLVVGDGESRGSFEEYARSRGVNEGVIFLGAQSRRVVAELMNSCDIFLSLYDISNCGNPLFEALLCGRPIVTLANGGTPDVITDGVNGRLLQPDDDAAIEKAVAELIEHSEIRANLGKGARAWAAENLLTWQLRLTREVNWVEEKIEAFKQ